MKTILVTGSEGFIGRNLLEVLKRRTDINILSFDIKDDRESLCKYLEIADIIFHIAGVNRPQHVEEFTVGNSDLTSFIIDRISQRERKPIIALSSSIQAELDNPYGVSKRQAEQILERYGNAGGTSIIYRLHNVFGKWSRPNYNSAVASFCHNIARGLEINISDPERIVELIYIDDVVRAFDNIIDIQPEAGCQRIDAGPVTRITLGQLTREIYQMHDIRTNLVLPKIDDYFRKCLYATYLSFLPTDQFYYSLEKREDQRGTLAELLKSPSIGQIFVSRTKPGFTRGNHYHDTKVEKFCVLEGEAVIRFRHVSGGEVLSYPVKGNEFKVVDIPPGYTHSIENVGDRDCIVLFWASEIFNPERPDTYFLPV